MAKKKMVQQEPQEQLEQAPVVDDVVVDEKSHKSDKWIAAMNIMHNGKFFQKGEIIIGADKEMIEKNLVLKA
jgi:hypothetical protein